MIENSIELKYCINYIRLFFSFHFILGSSQFWLLFFTLEMWNSERFLLYFEVIYDIYVFEKYI